MRVLIVIGSGECLHAALLSKDTSYDIRHYKIKIIFELSQYLLKKRDLRRNIHKSRI